MRMRQIYSETKRKLIALLQKHSMKNFLLFALVFFGVCIAHSQIINDNKFTFSYIQLPLTKIDPQHSLFEVLVVHEYNQANQDSIAIFNARKESAMQRFLFQMDIYYAQKDSIDRMYYTQLSSWEKKVNAGIKNADGTALPKPAAPKYPTQPIYPQLQEPQLHSSFSEDQATERITLSGFEQGSGEVQIIVKIQPIQNIRIVTKKYGSGSSTRYKYTAKYQMPVGIVVASPTEGILMETTMFTEEKSYKMANQKSQYDHELYMMDHKDDLFLKLESTARTEVPQRPEQRDKQPVWIRYEVQKSRNIFCQEIQELRLHRCNKCILNRYLSALKSVTGPRPIRRNGQTRRSNKCN
jgi:hypothetical protein